MREIVQGLVSIVGRVMLCAIFLIAAVASKIPDFNNVANSMGKQGIPLPEAALCGAIAFLVVGSVSVILGYRARIGAALLFAFLIVATYFFHDFWNVPVAEVQNQIAHSLKNCAMGGAMLMIMANGPGAWSLDNRRRAEPLTPGEPAVT